nr:MAG TPA: hypothetical protein [Herelleviridae sp.]
MMNFYDKVYEILNYEYPEWQRFFTKDRPSDNELRKDFAIDSTGIKYEEYIMGKFDVETASGDVAIHVVGVRRSKTDLGE